MNKMRKMSRRALIRKIEDQRDTVARLVDTCVEKDEEISELRELLTELENVRWEAERHVTCLRAEIDVSRMMFRNYRQDHGLLPSEGAVRAAEDDDWDGK